MTAVCPDCGHYEDAHTSGGNCHGAPEGAVWFCMCIRTRPIALEPPTQLLAEKIAALERDALDA